MHILILLLMLTSVNLSAKENDAFTVHLETESQLIPIYVAHIQAGNPGIDPSELANLESILRFDLNNNGMTAVAKTDSSLEAAAASLKEEGWANRGIYYVVVPKIEDKVLKAQVYFAINGTIKTIDKLTLEGNLSQDRGKVHALADAIHKLLFGKEGVARTHILYTVRKKIPGKQEWTSEIWESDYDGGNARRVLVDAGYTVTPQYFKSAPGKRPGSFFYVSYKNGQPKIYVGSLQNGVAKRLMMLPGNQLMPTLSYQRDKLAFISDVTGNPDLFVQDFSVDQGVLDKPRQVFSARHATQGTPTFSPDGKQLAFVSDKDGSPKIYMIDIPPVGAKLSDVRPRLATKFHKGCTAPAWSPDGQKIACSSQINGVRQIVVVDFVSGTEKQLTQGPGNKENPSWGPDSLHLVYNAGGEGGSDLFVMNLNQASPVKITVGKGEKRFPCWESCGN